MVWVDVNTSQYDQYAMSHLTTVSLDWTVSPLGCWCSAGILAKLARWRLRSGPDKWGRSTSAGWRETSQCKSHHVSRESSVDCRGVIQCRESLEVISYKIGVCRVSSSGKDCHTEFERLSSNGSSSVVLCRPFTGRMHQIRVHLQYLGRCPSVQVSKCPSVHVLQKCCPPCV